MRDLSKCVICNSTTHEKGMLFVCDACGHGFREYEDDLLKYHEVEYRTKFSRTYGEIENGVVTEKFHKARKKIVEDRLKKIHMQLNKSYTVLDIGSGAGTFAKVIEPFVKNITCLEVDPILVAESARLGFITFKEDFLTTNFTRKFDIIFAWHVLEHIEDANEFMKKCYNLVNKTVIIEVPTNRAPKEKFDGHVHYFNEESLQRLALLHGFGVVTVLDGVQKPAKLIILTK